MLTNYENWFFTLLHEFLRYYFNVNYVTNIWETVYHSKNVCIIRYEYSKWPFSSWIKGLLWILYFVLQTHTLKLLGVVKLFMNQSCKMLLCNKIFKEFVFFLTVFVTIFTIFVTKFNYPITIRIIKRKLVLTFYFNVNIILYSIIF